METFRDVERFKDTPLFELVTEPKGSDKVLMFGLELGLGFGFRIEGGFRVRIMIKVRVKVSTRVKVRVRE